MIEAKILLTDTDTGEVLELCTDVSTEYMDAVEKQKVLSDMIEEFPSWAESYVI